MKLGNQFKRLVHILAVAAKLRHLLPPVAAKVLDVIETGVTAIQALASALVSAQARARELTEVKREMREALRSDLEAIKRTAVAVAMAQPELDPNKFRFPGHGDQSLLTAARSIAGDATPLADAFVDHAMPPDFLDRLRERIEEFDQTLAGCAAATRTVDELKLRIKTTFEDTQSQAKRLDPVVRNVLGDDDVALAAWDKACRGRRRRPRRPTGSIETSLESEPESNEPEPPASGMIELETVEPAPENAEVGP